MSFGRDLAAETADGLPMELTGRGAKYPSEMRLAPGVEEAGKLIWQQKNTIGSTFFRMDSRPGVHTNVALCGWKSFLSRAPSRFESPDWKPLPHVPSNRF